MKSAWTFLFAGFLLFGNVMTVYAVSPYMVKHKDHVAQDWEIHADYPIFEQLESEELQNKVNIEIVQKLEDTLRDIRRIANEVYGAPVLYYEETDVYKDDNFYSVVMTSHISRENNYNSTVTSINFEDDRIGKIMSLSNMVNMERLNKEVRSRLAEEPDTYYHKTFNGVRDDTAFFIKGEQLTLIFNKYEIAPGVYGTPEIKVPYDLVESEEEADETSVPFPSIT